MKIIHPNKVTGQLLDIIQEAETELQKHVRDRVKAKFSQAAIATKPLGSGLYGD